MKRQLKLPSPVRDLEAGVKLRVGNSEGEYVGRWGDGCKKDNMDEEKYYMLIDEYVNV